MKSTKKAGLEPITILGAGPAGLAVGYYARKRGIPFVIYEAKDRIGGNCTTFRYGDFYFDSGAHRLHNRNPEVTREFKQLLGEQLILIDVPSQIHYDGRNINFPLTPLSLMRSLGFKRFCKATAEIVCSRLAGDTATNVNFEKFALHTYGKTIASMFLLNYTKKLWGLPCNQLSASIAGKRLKGLNLRSFFLEAMLGRRSATKHLEGAFSYPRMGIGTVVEKLAQSFNRQNIALNSKITRVFHNNSSIQALEINKKNVIGVDEVVSTLPLDRFIHMMDPPAPKNIRLLVDKLQYRNVKLVAFFLNKECITQTATTYFPDGETLFTRVYEPKNRCIHMSPQGKTNLVVEIPYGAGDIYETMDDSTLVKKVQEKLVCLNWVKRDDIIDVAVHNMEYAYPVLSLDADLIVRRTISFLEGFNNLKLSGRNAKFSYAWLHDVMKSGKEIIETRHDSQKLKHCGLEERD